MKTQFFSVFVWCIFSSQSISGLERDLTIKLSKSIPHFHCSFIKDKLEDFIHSASRELYDLTGDFFSTVNVVVPESLAKTDCLRNKILRTAAIPDENVLVTKSHPVFGDKIMAEQYGQCGSLGKAIRLPFGSFNLTKSSAKDLAGEWIKYNYGVFDEVGFLEDPLYPLYSVEGEVRVKHDGCEFKTEKVICPSDDYNRDVITKQNILCNGHSVREIIGLSIKDPNVTAIFRKPEFRWISSEKKLLVLVLDRSQRSHWDLLQRSLFQFITRLPIGVYLSVITYGSTRAFTNLPPTLITPSNQAGLHGRIPRRALDDDLETEDPVSCLSCALETALASSNNSGLFPVWILATGGSTNTLLQRVERIQEIKATGFPIYAISTSSSESYIQGLTDNHFIVKPDLTELSGALNSVLRLSTGKNLIPFHEEIFRVAASNGTKDKSLIGNFIVEDKLRKDLWIQATARDERDIEYFEVLSPTGQKYSFPSFEHGLAYFHLGGLNEAGIWSYNLKVYTDETNEYSVHVEVFGEANESDAVVLEAWNSIDSSQEIPKVYLYAKVTLGGILPVLGSEVEATVYSPNSKDGKVIRLKDSGTGYPDITKGDGIYSAYFTDFASLSGYYRMVVKATHNGGKARTPKVSSAESRKTLSESPIRCCGSSTPVSFTVPTIPFHRLYRPPSFYVEQPANFYARQGNSNDFFPPSRITDFALDGYEDSDSLFVHLKWTAPGGDYDKGSAFRYEIRCYTNKEALRDENFSEMSIPVHATLIPTPEEYGISQRCTVGVPWANEIFYYAIVAYDEAGNRGRISNTISVYIKEEPMSTTILNAEEGEIEKEEVAFYSGEIVKKEDITTYLIAGGISVILVLVIIGSALGILKYYRTLSRTKDLEETPNTTTSSLSGTLKKIMSLPDVTPEKGQLWTTSSSSSTTPTNLSDCEYSSKTSDYKQGLQTATSQEIPAVQRVDEIAKSSSGGGGEYYESDASENNNLLLGPHPRISVLEDYSVYRDLSNLSNKSHFSIGQLPQEIQNSRGVFITVPHYAEVNALESVGRKARHESLV